MTHTSTETERVEFEASVKKLFEQFVERDFKRHCDNYKYEGTQMLWELWQAARRAPVVQAEPTLAMLDAGWGICGIDGKPWPGLIDAANRKYAAMLAAAPLPPESETDSLGMPKSCGKPLCSPSKHHPLCDLAAPKPLSHHCTARTADGVCEECDMHAQELRDKAEHEALREVYENARGVLRYDGIDAARLQAYMQGLSNAVEEVKLIDSGLWEPEVAQEGGK